MRGFRVIYILVTVCLIVAAVRSDDYKEKTPCEEEPCLEGNADDNIENMIMLSDDDLGESFLFSEDSEYEEIEFEREFIEFEAETNLKVESAPHISSNKAFKRYKDAFSPEPSIKKRRMHKRDVSSCAPPELSIECNATYKYRTYDGTCNNLKNPGWGMANSCQERLLPANYNGASGFRTSVKGGPLPEARNLSLNLYENKNRPTKIHNHLFMFFGQFFAHDMVLSALPVKSDGELIDCCECQYENKKYCQDNIKVRKDDPFYSKYNLSCISLGRTASCQKCFQGDRKVLTLTTSFLDCSLVYGRSINESMSLRANDGTGKLLSQPSRTGELLPNSSDPEHDQCSIPAQDRICFRAGDPRVNQHTMITCLQTCVMRSHNYLATELKKINPSWDGEKTFQESRKIVIGTIQNICYREYLPLLLRPETISQYQLGISDNCSTYNPKSNPSILVEFTTSAFRTPHSNINTLVAVKPLKVTEGKQKMRDLFSRPFGIPNGSCDPLFVDTTNTSAQKIDIYEVKDITDFLYRPPGAPFGSDLASFDINRGRDHGLPTYVDMVNYCCNKTIEDFDDLCRKGFMTQENVKKLEQIYKNVKDVDLEVGMLMEMPQKNAMVGLTTSCVMGKQFHRLKSGDRYFYTHKGIFTKGQLVEMKKATMAWILCRNGNITALPKNALMFASKENPMVKCSCTGPDLSKWKEQRD